MAEYHSHVSDRSMTDWVMNLSSDDHPDQYRGFLADVENPHLKSTPTPKLTTYTLITYTLNTYTNPTPSSPTPSTPTLILHPHHLHPQHLH